MRTIHTQTPVTRSWHCHVAAEICFELQIVDIRTWKCSLKFITNAKYSVTLKQNQVHRMSINDAHLQVYTQFILEFHAIEKKERCWPPLASPAFLALSLPPFALPHSPSHLLPHCRSLPHNLGSIVIVFLVVADKPFSQLWILWVSSIQILDLWSRWGRGQC